MELVQQSVLESKTVVATLATEETATVERSEPSYAEPSELVQQSGLESKTIVTLATEETATVEPSELSRAGPVSELVEQFGLESKTVVATLATEETTTSEPSEPSHAGRALELVKQSGLESNALFATFASEPIGTIEYGFDGSVVSFQDTQEQALKMFNIALRKPISLDLLLAELQTISKGATNRKGKRSKSRFRALHL